TGEPIELDQDDGDGDGDGDGGEDDEAEKKPEPVDPSRGIVMADELTFATVEIRERKIELKVEANSSPAQDRLNSKLRQVACITNIQNGKVSSSGGRRRFDMTMDNGCYYAAPEAEEGD